MKIYDRNRNVLTLGQRVMIAATAQSTPPRRRTPTT